MRLMAMADGDAMSAICRPLTCYLPFALCHLPFAHLHVFHHDHRVGAGRQRVAGVHVERLLADSEVDGLGLAGAARLLGAHRIAVHRGGVIVRRGDPRPDRLRGDAAGGLVQRHRLARQRHVQPGLGQRGPPAGKRVAQRDVFQIG